MELGLNELRSLWDRPLADTKSRSVEAFAWHDAGDSASFAQTGRASARTSPIAAAGGDQSAAAGSVMDVWALALRAP
jgi:hypothetical protein